MLTNAIKQLLMVSELALELVLKTACAVYSTMSHVSKRQGKAIEKQFERLCKLLATNLTPPDYASLPIWKVLMTRMVRRRVKKTIK